MKLLLSLFLSISLTASTLLSVARFKKANNLLACDLYQTNSNSSSGNFLASPFAINTQLVLLLVTAKGQTAREICRALHITERIRIEPAIKYLIFTFKYSSFFKFYLANKLYVRMKCTIDSDFKRFATKVYDTDIQKIRFSRNVEAARSINKWVEGGTDNRIKDLMDPKQLNRSTKAVLVNGLYFKGTWKIPFEMIKKKRGFFKTETDEVRVDYLCLRNAILKYHKDVSSGDQYLKLKLWGRASLYIILPAKKNGLEETEKRLKESCSLPIMLRKRLNVNIPKFKFTSLISVKAILKKLGVNDLFLENKAEIKGIVNGTDLYVNDIVHKAYIDVNQYGVGVTEGTETIAPRPLMGFRAHDFVADHPFLFIIRIYKLDIFIGRVTDPTK